MKAETEARAGIPASEPQERSGIPASETEGAAAAPRLSVGNLKHGFRALQVRNYRLFWIGQLISLTGTWMQTTAQAWLVIQLTHQPFALGLVTTFQFLPIMLLSLVGGVITDRLPKHRLLLVTQTAALVQAAVFGTLVATGLIQLWHIYILAAIQGTINAIDTPTRQAFVPELAGRAHLINAIALNSMLFNAARIVGPAVAGLLIANIGIAPALLLNAASFLGVIFGLLRMDPAALFQAPPRGGGAVGSRLLEGFRYVWRTPQVLLVMMLMAAIGTFGYNFSVVLPLVAGFVVKTGADGFGVLSSFLGAGSLLAAITTAYSKKVTSRRLLGGAAAFSGLLGALALSTQFALTAALLVLLGFAGIIFTTSANTLLQLTVPDELRGRVLSLYIMLFAGSTPIGAFVIGSLSTIIGVSGALLLCAGLCLAGVAGGFLYYRRIA